MRGVGGLMQIGEKIRKIRKFRGISQREFEEMAGLGKNRLAQYESGYRIPRLELLDKMAKLLDVSLLSLKEVNGEDPYEIMEIFFWLEEASPEVIVLFQMNSMRGETAEHFPEEVLYRDDEKWTIREPIGMWFNHPLIDGFLKEWIYHKQELERGEITQDEYFEWKIGWPFTRDLCGTITPDKKWRK